MLNFNTNRSSKDFSDPTQHAQRVPLIGRRFQTANLLLRCPNPLSQFFLREPGLLSKGNKLNGDVPGFAGLNEFLSQTRIFQLLFKIEVKMNFLHICVDKFYTKFHEESTSNLMLC